MGLDIGPGLDKWIRDHNAEPLSGECYLSPDFPASAVYIEIANERGQKIRTLVGYDKATGLIIPPGAGVLVPELPPPAPVQPLTMYDSVTASDIPTGVDVVAGYMDGLYAWSDQDWSRHSDSQLLRITVLGSVHADIADVEQGDLSATQAADWLRRRKAAGLGGVPVIYCNLSTIGAVRAACAGLEWDWWAAAPTGQAHLIQGSCATQYAWPTYGSGGHFDVSLCAPFWPRE